MWRRSWIHIQQHLSCFGENWKKHAEVTIKNVQGISTNYAENKGLLWTSSSFWKGFLILVKESDKECPTSEQTTTAIGLPIVRCLSHLDQVKVSTVQHCYQDSTWVWDHFSDSTHVVWSTALFKRFIDPSYYQAYWTDGHQCRLK